ATRRKHEEWGSTTSPKPRQEKSRGGGRVRHASKNRLQCSTREPHLQDKTRNVLQSLPL
ncbi:hypothetical protein T265_14095, partial [Opisthorchis viverrini]